MIVDPRRSAHPGCGQMMIKPSFLAMSPLSFCISTSARLPRLSPRWRPTLTRHLGNGFHRLATQQSFEHILIFCSYGFQDFRVVTDQINTMFF